MARYFFYIAMLLCSVSIYALQPSEAFNRLVEGNKRFQKEKNSMPRRNQERRQSTNISQSPFAVIVACADSRVAPEILFDQGIGDLFVVRVAGNVIGPLEMESVKYAAKYLGSSCILVMGHQNCGAVDAVIQGQTQDVRFIAQIIKPSVLRAKNSYTHNLLETATKFNAEAMSEFLKQSPLIESLMNKGKIDVRAAYYNFDTGAVEML